MEKTRGWWIQRALSALASFCESDAAVQQTRAMVSEHGFCRSHADVAAYLERDDREMTCIHCEQAMELLGDKKSALRTRAGKKATLLRVAKRAGLSARETIPRKARGVAPRATLGSET